MPVQELSITPPVERFQHSDAHKIVQTVLAHPLARTFVLDLNRVRDASTDAFAALIVLRRRLLSLGRDLRISNLGGRAQRVYTFNRLAEVLPCT